MNIVMVFTVDSLETMISKGGSGCWSANKKRLESCTYLVAATKSEDTKGSAFLVGKISNISDTLEGNRLLIQFSEYAKINIPDVWVPGNRNPVAYTDTESFQKEHGLDFSEIQWSDFPVVDLDPLAAVKAITIDEAKRGIAKTLAVDPSCIEILIKA